MQMSKICSTICSARARIAAGSRVSTLDSRTVSSLETSACFTPTALPKSHALPLRALGTFATTTGSESALRGSRVRFVSLSSHPQPQSQQRYFPPPFRIVRETSSSQDFYFCLNLIPPLMFPRVWGKHKVHPGRTPCTRVRVGVIRQRVGRFYNGGPPSDWPPASHASLHGLLPLRIRLIF